MIPKSFLLILCDSQIEGRRITPTENSQVSLFYENRTLALLLAPVQQWAVFKVYMSTRNKVNILTKSLATKSRG